MEKLSISKQFFHQLVKQLEKNISGLYVSETDKWCGIYQK